MRGCRTHRRLYHRLARLPTVRAVGRIVVVTLVVTVVSTLVTPWLAGVVVVVGAAVGFGEHRRNRARAAVELHMARTLIRSAHRCVHEVDITGLTAAARAEILPDGVTRIDASCQLDAVRALGYVMGRDRGFQLDSLRRTARGRLAEVLGAPMLPVDAQYRPLGLAEAAQRAAAALDAPERELLTAFATGVNAAFDQHGPPFECRFLSSWPEPWVIEDSLAISLFVLHGLSWNEEPKRSEAVIRAALPDHIARFFLPADQAELPEDLADFRATGEIADVVTLDTAVAGSNCWVRRNPDGMVLACDLHLPLAMPNLMYEVDLRWPGTRLQGLMTVGIPVVVTGSNGRLVWGVTNLSADVVDLVPVEATDELQTAVEPIGVRGRKPVGIKSTRYNGMPVSPAPLLGRAVAVRWTGQDVRSSDLKLQRLAQATSVEQAIKVLDDADGLPLNVLLADDAGSLAHLATGLLRRHPVGPADSGDGDHLTGSERPRLVDPPAGVLVSANDAGLPQDRFRIGFDVDPGARARRARRLLEASEATTVDAMRALQRDTVAAAYEPYRDLAVAALAGRDDRLAGLLSGWNGRADVDSRAFGVLVRLREILAQRVLSLYLGACRDHDPGFTYAFRDLDRPLLAILRRRDGSLLARDHEAGAWSDLVAAWAHLAMTEVSASTRRKRSPRWGQLNAVGLRHSLERLAPWSAGLLGLAPKPQPGALHCLRTCVPGFGAVGRAVLEPGPDGTASFELPAGQSGHPLSRHYDDRHRQWAGIGPSAPRRRRSRACATDLRPAGH